MNFVCVVGDEGVGDRNGRKQRDNQRIQLSWLRDDQYQNELVQSDQLWDMFEGGVVNI